MASVASSRRTWLQAAFQCPDLAIADLEIMISGAELDLDTPLAPRDWLAKLKEDEKARQSRVLVQNAVASTILLIGVGALLVAGKKVKQTFQQVRRKLHKRPSQRNRSHSIKSTDVPMMFFANGESSGSSEHSKHSLSSHAGTEATQKGASGFEPLWDPDFISPDSLEFAHRPDGSVWVLGSGSFGQVIKGVRDGVHDVALKISTCKLDTNSEAFTREVALLKSCRNSNIVQFQGVCVVDDCVWLVMEYMGGGNLYSLLMNSRGWQWNQRAAVMGLDIARGVAYLHSKSVIHLDLKSANILLTADGRAKIADVGLAHMMKENRTHASNLAMGTFAWMAPEVILSGRAGYSADIFSLGVILWELVTGEVPQRGRMRALRSPEDCPEPVASLVTECLSSDPRERPTAKDVAVRLRAIVGQGRLREHLSSSGLDQSGLTSPSSGLSLRNYSGTNGIRPPCSIASVRPSFGKISAPPVLERAPGDASYDEFAAPVPAFSPFSVLASKALSTSTCPSGDLTAADFPSSDGLLPLPGVLENVPDPLNPSVTRRKSREQHAVSPSDLPGSWIMDAG
eukprot:jgi/Botrbrau1/4327/Bobra.0232s0018.1